MRIALEKLKKLLIYVVMLPLYWLSFIIPKDKNLWVFGAWFGERYADNSKYLFEYVNKYHPEIKAVWLTSNRKTFEIVKNKGYNVLKISSLKGIVYSLRAKVGIISTGLRDINMYLTGNMQIVQLWHGTPLKRIMFDDKVTFRPPTTFKKILFLVFPFLKKNLYYSDALLIATSEEVRKKISSAFRVPLERVKVTGYPRNDSFFQDYRENLEFAKKMLHLKLKGKKLAIYMPTHRKEGEMDISKLLFSDMEFIDKKLQELNCMLLVKLHYYHTNESLHLRKKKFSNIIMLNDDLIEHDIYAILKLVDILITDYSSVYFDFLLLDKPIIFAPFDMESYLKNDREFYYDYNEVTPGPKAKNWNEVLVYLKEAIENPEKYGKERERIKKIFHKYQDGNSSKRVFNEIIKSIS
ncbi:CDP-glycerol glycerophosphotransferase family protein [Desulfurobacterium crinifex]